MSYFCDLIRKDADRLSNLFEADNCEKPIVYKMKFRCKDSKFKFELKIEKDLPSDFQPVQVFIEWKQKIKNKNSTSSIYCNDLQLIVRGGFVLENINILFRNYSSFRCYNPFYTSRSFRKSIYYGF